VLAFKEVVMRVRHGMIGLLAIGLAVGQVSAQSVEQTSFIFRRPAPCNECGMPVTGPVTVVPSDGAKKDEAPMVDAQAFAQAPAAGGSAELSFNPAMFGDLAGSGIAFVNVPVVIRGGTPSTPTSTLSTSRVRVPIITHGSFKISDNESPRPTDRVFFTYNYYNRVEAPGLTFPLNRELIGFEKTFLDGNASFGMRLPFQQTSTGSNLAEFTNHEIADMTLIGKYAFINDRETGNVLSGGLALTVPSADHTVILADGHALRSVLFQPYVGWIINRGDFFAQAFHSLVVPTDSRDLTEMNNDVGVGYWAYRNPDGFLRGIVPTVEGHLFTPLNHQNKNDLLYGPDIFTLTAGVNFVMPGNSTLGAAVAVPLTGPRPDNIEAIVSFNFRF
jgi:hypothetical protein